MIYEYRCSEPSLIFILILGRIKLSFLPIIFNKYFVTFHNILTKRNQHNTEKAALTTHTVICMQSEDTGNLT